LPTSDEKTIYQKKLIKAKLFLEILKSFDALLKIATTPTSVTLSSRTVFGLIVKPISTDVSCGLSLSNEVISEKKGTKIEKKYERA